MRRLFETFSYAVACAAAMLLIACGGGGNQNAAPAASGAAAPAGATTGVDPATAASIAGIVHFEGTAPKAEPIKLSSDPYCQTANPGLTTDTEIVGAGGAVQNVFVYVKDGLGNRTFPAPADPVVLDQKGCHYSPHVIGIQIGQPLEIINSDNTLHNVHAVAMANAEFNAGQPQAGVKTTHVFSTKEVMIPFKCDVHGWMHAWVGVLDHPFYAVTGADGAFSLKGLPPGTYTIEAWHEKLGTQTQMVTIGAKENKDVAFTFKGA
jgi:plastocyanin